MVFNCPINPFIFQPRMVTHHPKRGQWPRGSGISIVIDDYFNYFFYEGGDLYRRHIKTGKSEAIQIDGTKEHLLITLVSWGFRLDADNLNALFRELFLVNQPVKLQLVSSQ